MCENWRRHSCQNNNGDRRRGGGGFQRLNYSATRLLTDYNSFFCRSQSHQWPASVDKAHKWYLRIHLGDVTAHSQCEGFHEGLLSRKDCKFPTAQNQRGRECGWKRVSANIATAAAASLSYIASGFSPCCLGMC